MTGCWAGRTQSSRYPSPQRPPCLRPAPVVQPLAGVGRRPFWRGGQVQGRRSEGGRQTGRRGSLHGACWSAQCCCISVQFQSNCGVGLYPVDAQAQANTDVHIHTRIVLLMCFLGSALEVMHIRVLSKIAAGCHRRTTHGIRSSPTARGAATHEMIFTNVTERCGTKWTINTKALDSQSGRVY